MGRDKALLPHPEGGTWLERQLRLLLALDRPVTLLSGHPAHGALAEALRAERPLTVLREPEPREGPLLALARLMAHHPGARLLLCPVDMPWLDLASLQALLAAAENAPRGDGAGAERIHLAHDGERLQPLVGIYPSPASRRQRLEAALAAGERGMGRWLAGEDWRPVPLPAPPLRNINRPGELPPSVLLAAADGP